MGCASLGRQWWHGEGMRRPKRAVVERRGDAPAKNGQWLCGEGMRQPNGATPNWWVGGECAGKRRDRNWRRMRWSSETTPNRWRLGGECASQMEQHQIGGSAANAPAKRNNTKSVDRRRIRRPNGTTPNRWIGGECAGKRKRMRRGDEMRRPNSNTKSVGRRRMRRRNGRECGAAMRCAGRTAKPNRWIGSKCAGKRKRMRRGDGMRQPNKETAAR